MKTQILVMGLLSLTAWNVVAQVSERVIFKDSKTFSTQISDTSVRCSHIGYGYDELKISLLALDGWTIFDHSNAAFGEVGEPCMTAGICRDDFNVDTVLQNNPGLETVTVEREIIEYKQLVKDMPFVGEHSERCVRSLGEILVTNVRGIRFTHARSGAEQSLPAAACR